jgi:ethanolamine utilization protein EutQ (cupin superfamily)
MIRLRSRIEGNSKIALDMINNEPADDKMKRCANRVMFELWKEGKNDEISYVMENDFHISVDDIVMLHTEPGGIKLIGPYQVLEFDMKGNMFLDKDNFQETVPVDNVAYIITELDKGGEK